MGYSLGSTRMKNRLWMWAYAWADLFEALAGVLSFASWWPHWGMKLRVWKMEEEMRVWKMKDMKE